MITIRKPTVEEIVEQQRMYEVGQFRKIEQSNSRLNQLEEKMRVLMQKDKSKGKRKMFSDNGKFYGGEVGSWKGEGYVQDGGNKMDNRRYDDGECGNDEELLLGDNQNQGDRFEGERKNYNHFSIEQPKRRQLMNSNTLKSNINPKRNKSSSSLRILNNKKPSPTPPHTPSPTPQPPNPSHSLPIQPSKPKHIQPAISHNSPIPQPQPPAPTPSLLQITQLQQLILKSIQLKQKQLHLAQQQLHQLQRQKLEEYRKHTQLEVQLENIRQARIMLQGNGNRVNVGNINNNEIKLICCQALKEKEQLQIGYQKLDRELKLLLQQEFRLNLDKKKVMFQYNSLKRQFRRLFKSKSRQNIYSKSKTKAKQNIPDNNQHDDLTTQRQLSKRYNSSKKFITHKKKSLSHLQPSSIKQPLPSNPKHPQLSNPKQCQPPNPNPFNTTCQKPSKPKQPTKSITKSTSHTGLHQSSSKNRHGLSNCQAIHDKCETNQILYSMVNQLDKLKGIVNREIVKTKKRKTIDLNGIYSCNRDKVSSFR